MMKMFLSAGATGTIVFGALNLFTHGGFTESHLRAQPFCLTKGLLGGLVLGLGMALDGSCPGTSLVQFGAGREDALWNIIGGFGGAFIFSLMAPAIE